MGKKTGRLCTLCLGFTYPVCFLAGIALIAGGVALYVEFPTLITSQVDQRVTVEKGHATYEQLQEPSVAIFKDFFFFNLTNYKEFHKEKGGVKPVFDEVGPYSFTELRTKDLSETDNISELSYTQQKIFFFNKTKSGANLSESDVICTINIPLIGAINTTKECGKKRAALKLAIATTFAKLYVCVKATELAWGYSDEFIKLLHWSKEYPLDKVSIQVNDSADDQNPSIINTGKSDIKQVGQFIQWNGRRELGKWHGEANRIHGTEGFFFRPNLQEGDKLTAFVDDLMRSFDIQYEGRVNHLGLNAFRYGIDNTTFLSAFSERKNADYFSWCPDGMFFLGPTQVVEIPVYGSKPHFLDADPLLLESVVGLTPDREKHDTVIDIEPITGANVNFQRRLQVVVQVNKTEKHGLFDTIHIADNIQGYKNSGVLYFPVLYINEHATMDEDFKNYLEGKGLKLVQIFNDAVPAAFAFLLFLGVLLVFLGFLIMFIWMKRVKRSDRRENIPLLHSEPTVQQS